MVEKPEKQQIICSQCDKVAFFKCSDCKEYFCEDCGTYDCIDGCCPNCSDLTYLDEIKKA